MKLTAPPTADDLPLPEPLAMAPAPERENTNVSLSDVTLSAPDVTTIGPVFRTYARALSMSTFTAIDPEEASESFV